MGTILAQTIVNNVTAEILNDIGKVRFLEAHLLDFLNEGGRTIAALMPSIYSAPASITLIGGCVQTIPATAHTLLKPRHNVVGGVPGRAITAVKEELLNTVDPNWRGGVQSATIKHIHYDPLVDQNTFLCYPPAINGSIISCVLGNIPQNLLISDPIWFDDIYESPLKNFVLARAFEKDAEYAGNPERTSYYMGLMNAQLGIQGQNASATPVSK